MTQQKQEDIFKAKSPQNELKQKCQNWRKCPKSAVLLCKKNDSF